jgi:apolipoprotein N-acyltransferase
MSASLPEQSRPSEKKVHFISLTAMAVVSGLLLAATIPVRGIPQIMFIALVPLLLAEDIIHKNRSNYRKGSFWLLAIMTFAVYGAFGSWWLKNAHWFGAVSAVLVNTLMMSSAFLLFHQGRKAFSKDFSAYTYLVVVWLAMEYFHHNWDLTYPWFSLGNVFSTSPKWIQWYEYTGVLGGSLWLLTANILIFLLLRGIWFKSVQKKHIFASVALIIAWITLPAAFSFYRYATYFDTESKSGYQTDPIEVIIVQPNNDPYLVQYTIDPQTAVGNFLHLAAPLMSDHTRFIVGPESMIQENIWEDHLDQSPSIDSLSGFVAHHPSLTIINGASSFRMLRKGQPVTLSARKIDPEFLPVYAERFQVPLETLSGYYDAYNLGFAMDTSGITGLTHKSKLVAGVERMPFKKYLSSVLGDIALDMGGTVGTLASDSHRFVFRHNQSGYRYGVAICYESVFGEFFGEFVRNGATMMFIITNDGWWGNTPGHRQHNAFATLRSIETRRDIARSANTGISCFVNQRGDVLQPTRYWEPAALKGTITPNSKITFYVRYGDYFGRIAALLAIFMFVASLSCRLLTAFRRHSQ